MISKLSLRAKLDLNSKIESRNNERELKRWSRAPQSTEADSDDESVISVSELELASLTEPIIFDSLSPIMPLFIKEEIAKRKRRTDPATGSDTSADSDSHVDKRRCVDGSYLKTLVDQPISDVAIPNVLYDTANAGLYIPLHLFESSALIYINRHQLEIVHDGKVVKNFKVLDVRSLTKALGGVDEEHSAFTYERFLNASDNFVRFQGSRDIAGPLGDWAKTWFYHFKFFTNKPDAYQTFPFWKSPELSLRGDLHHRASAFNGTTYQQVYMLAQSAFTMSRFNTPSLSSSSRPAPMSSSSSSKPQPEKSSQSFRTSGKTSSPTCVICCGPHNGLSHCANRNKDSFPDGKPTWLKSNTGKPLSPNGDEVCLKFNTLSLKDTRDGKPCGASHDGSRLHICSFCGSHDHGAFHWKCRSQSN